MKVIKIPFDQIKQFSSRDKSYQLNPEQFGEFIAQRPSYDNLKLQAKGISDYSYDRTLLHQTILKQYQGLTLNPALSNNIEALKKENTYTVCTAHQLSLFTGPLYYIFKILSTVKLAKEINLKKSAFKVVPIFVHGGEDHDLDEINHLQLYGKEIHWDRETAGATGRMSLEKIEAVCEQVFDILGGHDTITELKAETKKILEASSTYVEFMFGFVHLLLGHLGIVQINMDNRSLKSKFAEIIKKELETNFSKLTVDAQIKKLKQLGFKAQANPRAINLFYLTEGKRNRITKTDLGFEVLNTKLKFSAEEMMQEVNEHPDRFSPNVVMRPLYQQLILPNLAYIGGGGELAYWLERKTQFEQAGIFFPMLIRRNSAALIDKKKYDQWKNLGLNEQHLSLDLHQLTDVYLNIKNVLPINFSSFAVRLKEIYEELDTELKSLDQTLSKALAGESTKAINGINHLENKVKKLTKQQESVAVKRMEKINSFLYPANGLQERKSNILEFYNTRGTALFDQILDEMDPLETDFKIFVLES